MAVRPPPITTTGRRIWRLAMEFFLAAPVSCSAIRKSDAAGTTRAIGRNAGLLDRQRLDFEAIDADHGVSIVHQMVREVETGGAQPDHQHGAAGRRPRDGPPQVEWIPARQQGVDLEAPGQPE